MFEPLLPVNFLRRAARLFPDKIAVIDGERRDTYRTLAARVNRLSNALRRMGAGQGDKVAVLSPNSHRIHSAGDLTGAPHSTSGWSLRPGWR